MPAATHTQRPVPAFIFFQEKNLDWFPRMRAMSLVSNEGDSEQNEIRTLQEKLESTMSLVKQLSGQLAELKEQVSEREPPATVPSCAVRAGTPPLCGKTLHSVEGPLCYW